MSYNFPATVQHGIQQYAKAEHITVDQAALEIVQAGLQSVGRKSSKGELTELEWQKVKEADPAFAFFSELPESVIDSIEAASKQTRAEKPKSRA